MITLLHFINYFIIIVAGITIVEWIKSCFNWYQTDLFWLEKTLLVLQDQAMRSHSWPSFTMCTSHTHTHTHTHTHIHTHIYICQSCFCKIIKDNQEKNFLKSFWLLPLSIFNLQIKRKCHGNKMIYKQ